MSVLFALATAVVHGDDSAQEIGAQARSAGLRRAMIVTDAGVHRAGLADAVADSVRQADVTARLYDQVSPNPRDEECYAGAAALTRAGAGLVVAVGGGSVIDAAKVMGLLAASGGKVEDYAVGTASQAAAPPMLPVYAVPTTCGSGAEVSPTALITVASSHRKVTVRPCPPAMAFVDPLLNLGMPPAITASTGMDALSHALEAYLSPGASPYTDAFAAQAIRMIAARLGPAVESTGIARHPHIAAMMYAANLAGFALRAGTGQLHSLSHALGAVLDTPHGVAIAVLLPAVLEYHLERLAPRLAEVARLMDEPTHGLHERQAAHKAIAAIARLRERLGLPTKLGQLGVSEEHIPALADVVMSPDEAWRRDRPCVCSRQDVLAMYRLAL